MDSFVIDRIIDSSLALMECREIQVHQSKVIQELKNEFIESQSIIGGKNAVIKGKDEVIKTYKDKENILMDSITNLEKANKKARFKSRLFGSLGFIGAGIGGYLIGKQ